MYRIILLTYLGIVINQYKDPYEPIRISWNAIRVLNAANTLPKFNIDTKTLVWKMYLLSTDNYVGHLCEKKIREDILLQRFLSELVEKP